MLSRTRDQSPVKASYVTPVVDPLTRISLVVAKSDVPVTTWYLRLVEYSTNVSEDPVSCGLLIVGAIGGMIWICYLTTLL